MRFYGLIFLFRIKPGGAGSPFEFPRRPRLENGPNNDFARDIIEAFTWREKEKKRNNRRGYKLRLDFDNQTGKRDEIFCFDPVRSISDVNPYRVHGFNLRIMISARPVKIILREN